MLACSTGLYKYVLSMLTEYVCISRVPACADELSDRRRETRNGQFLGRSTPDVSTLKWAPTSIAVAHRNGFITRTID
jgi:hypothetical protein